MNAFLEFLGAWLADFYLFSTLLLAVALGAITFMRQPARKLAVIKATVLAIFLLSALCALPNWSSVHLTEAPAAFPESSSYSSSSSSSPTPAATPSREAPSHPQSSDPSPTPSSPTTSEIETKSPAATPPHSRNSATLFVWIFLAGTSLIALWLALGAWHLARLSRESEPAPKNLLVLMEKIAGAGPVAMLPRLRIAARLPSAVATGIWESTILLPRPLAENADPDELGAVLAHEWAHVKNGDLRLLAFVRVLMLLLWAHPLYWLLRRRVRLEQELLADAAAAEHTNRRDYAAQLIDWARNLPASPHASLASSVGIWEGPSQLKRRVSLLLDDTVTLHRRCSRAWRLTAGSLGVLAAFALSFLTLRPETAAAETGTSPESTAAAAETDADTRDETILSEIHGTSGDYRNILGHWRVVSVTGAGGSFMGIDEKTEPGDIITIPHVRAPGPDYEGRSKIYRKSPHITLWMSPATRQRWTREDSLHLHPEGSPARATYKAGGGTKGHFDDPETPPDFAIYRFDDKGDTLTLLMGDPKDFRVNEGQETTITSAGTPARWTWRLVIPNYPKDFTLDPGRRQLLVTLKRAPSQPAAVPGEKSDEHQHPGDKLAAATLQAHHEDVAARRSRQFSPNETRAWYERSLIRLTIALDQAKDHELRFSIALAALGYANTVNRYEQSEKLILEMIEHGSKRDAIRIAEWYAELGGIHRKLARSAPNEEASSARLQQADEAFAQAIRRIEGSPLRESPQAYRRLILTWINRAQAAGWQYELSEAAADREKTTDHYRAGANLLTDLRALSASGKEWRPASGAGSHGGHGGTQTYSSVLENLLVQGYDEKWFENHVESLPKK